MERYLNKEIKEIIKEYPQIAAILNRYGIGCVTCTVGSCSLKDIVTLHHLGPPTQEQLMGQIEGVLYPGRPPRSQSLASLDTTISKEDFSFSPPIQQLVDEHKLIKRMLALLPAITASTELTEELIYSLTDFIRSYADKFHHAKEEDILFKYVDPNLPAISVMFAEHQEGRAHVQAILENLSLKNSEGIKKHLRLYGDLLTEHIQKEDQILYPFIERNLSDSDIGCLYQEFAEVQKGFAGTQTRYENFINELETIFS